MESVLELELGLAPLGVDDTEALLEEGFEDVEVVDGAAAELVERADTTVIMCRLRKMSVTTV